MSAFAQMFFVLGLGVFWGASTPINKALGLAGVPVTYILVASGFGVGLGLMLLQWLGGGRLRMTRREVIYGFCCGTLLNIPFVVGLFAIRHVPVTLTAVITSTAPLCTYALTLALGRQTHNGARLLALLIGFVSCAIVIVTRTGAGFGAIDGWVLITAALPILYAAYNVYTAMAWPKGMQPLTAGIGESFSQALYGVPFLFWPGAVAPGNSTAGHLGSLLLLAVTLMWILERVCYFKMIQRFGAVTTVQAVYVATPASVVLGLLFFNESTDAWLWLSLALLMLALWLNNRAVSS